MMTVLVKDDRGSHALDVLAPTLCVLCQLLAVAAAASLVVCSFMIFQRMCVVSLGSHDEGSFTTSEAVMPRVLKRGSALLQALARARSGQQLAVAVATALVLLVAARLGGGTTPLSLATAGPLAAAAGALAFTRVLKLAERKLTLSDYDHAKH